MKIIITTILAFTIFISACTSDTKNKDAKDNNNVENKVGESKQKYFFNYSVDGQSFSISPDDILTSYNTMGDNFVFKIFAGAEGKTQFVLTIPNDMSKPSTTPNGSRDFKLEITQGSVSLQNYPERTYTTNSFNTTYPEMSVVKPDAIVISNSEVIGGKGRVISGSFDCTTYGTKDSKDPKDVNHQVKGNFKIFHEFSPSQGGNF